MPLDHAYNENRENGETNTIRESVFGAVSICFILSVFCVLFRCSGFSLLFIHLIFFFKHFVRCFSFVFPIETRFYINSNNTHYIRCDSNDFKLVLYIMCVGRLFLYDYWRCTAFQINLKFIAGFPFTSFAFAVYNKRISNSKLNECHSSPW